MLSHINQKTQSNEDDDGSGSFGVGKLCDWMFNHEVVNTTPYDHIVKPVILKMIMDSFHYINLLENKLQVEGNSCGYDYQKTIIANNVYF